MLRGTWGLFVFGTRAGNVLRGCAVAGGIEIGLAFSTGSSVEPVESPLLTPSVTHGSYVVAFARLTSREDRKLSIYLVIVEPALGLEPRTC